MSPALEDFSVWSESVAGKKRFKSRGIKSNPARNCSM